MIEWDVTLGDMGHIASAWTNGPLGFMLSTAVGSPAPPATLSLLAFNLARSSTSFTSAAGRETNLRTRLRTSDETRKLPLCGVEMKITRVTAGTGSKNTTR